MQLAAVIVFNQALNSQAFAHRYYERLLQTCLETAIFATHGLVSAGIFRFLPGNFRLEGSTFSL